MYQICNTNETICVIVFMSEWRSIDKQFEGGRIWVGDYERSEMANGKKIRDYIEIRDLCIGMNKEIRKLKRNFRSK